MAEVQTNTQSGEMTQRFVEFVMMQAQHAAIFLGQIPNPQSGQPEVNLEVARMFIDQLVMIQEKTRGNLTNDEQTVLKNALSSLQMAFVEASQGEPKSSISAPEQPAPMAAAPSDPDPGRSVEAPTAPSESESKKKFTKSYGA